MKEEPESVLEFRVNATLAVLPVFWLVVLYLLAVALPEAILSQLGLDIGLCVGATVPLLIVSGLMLERAFTVRRGGDSS
jgi:hypothetical protein